MTMMILQAKAPPSTAHFLTHFNSFLIFSQHKLFLFSSSYFALFLQYTIRQLGRLISSFIYCEPDWTICFLLKLLTTPGLPYSAFSHITSSLAWALKDLSKPSFTQYMLGGFPLWSLSSGNRAPKAIWMIWFLFLCLVYLWAYTNSHTKARVVNTQGGVKRSSPRCNRTVFASWCSRQKL